MRIGEIQPQSPATNTQSFSGNPTMQPQDSMRAIYCPRFALSIHFCFPLQINFIYGKSKFRVTMSTRSSGCRRRRTWGESGSRRETAARRQGLLLELGDCKAADGGAED